MKPTTKQRDQLSGSQLLESKGSEGQTKCSRYLKDGFVVYSSDNMHHSRDKVRGFLYKRAEKVNFFAFNLYHKRYWIISAH